VEHLRLIITRPEPAASRTAERLRALGHQVTVSPVLKIVDTGAKMPDSAFDAMIITSANALRIMTARGIDQNLLNLPVFTVGDATAQKAEQLGFTNVVSASGNAEKLARTIIDRVLSKPNGSKTLLYACGIETTPGLVDELQNNQFNVLPWALYNAILVNRLTKISCNWLQDKEDVGVLLYSARSARQFSIIIGEHTVAQHIEKTQLFVISAKVKSALSPALQPYCKTAQYPGEDSLFEQIPN
jgi:uroporphyrinogen-III synthase